MVKVQDEDGCVPARPRPTKALAVSSGTNNVATQLFHYHWSYPSSSTHPPATFHFGPGFEPQTSPQQHVVYFHVNPGVTVSFQMGDNVQVIKGPVTVPMVSTNSSPPIAMPVQVPHGHVVQQIVDESGTLRHVILSPQHPPIVPMPPHFGPGPASGSNQPFYAAQGLPPGYPPFHTSPLQPGVLSHGPPQQQGHSPPPPPHSFHKDERSQRQYIKLKKKLEQKQMRGGEMNGMKSANYDSCRKGMSSVGTSEDGEESSSVQDEDEDTSLIADLLANIKSPLVAELSCRSALLQWWPPDCKANPELEISESDLRYEVLLSDKGKEGKYKSIYTGIALSCRIEDLRPGTEYSVCVGARLGSCAGCASEPTVLRTPPCAPDTPAPPRLGSRSRTALQLKWTAPPDNGSPITLYALETDNGSGWSEVLRGKAKQFSMTKLQPATAYKFRLMAANDCGKSDYSVEVSYCTCDSPPSQPGPPRLVEATVTSLSLAWQSRPSDDEYTLQMEDRESGHGFLPVYNGKEAFYVCQGLRRHTIYKFRLKAQNEEGGSRWSDEVSYRTVPARPGAPSRPSVKGRVHAHSFKLRWDPPADKGGADIAQYHLQIKDGSDYRDIYSGLETECLVDRLMPGTCYELRLSCEGPGGCSDPCDSMAVTTEPVCPGRCAPPRLHSKPRPTTIALHWNYPDTDGGSPVTDLELLVKGGLGAEDGSGESAGEERTAYKGRETECVVGKLQPGQPYVFLLRAFNKVGSGPWSEGLKVRSGSAPPGTPNAPTLTPLGGAHTVTCQWMPPPCHGAPITEYRLEVAHGLADFGVAYQGPATLCDVKHLPPATLCHFRVQAWNSCGGSEPSTCASLVTGPSVPGTVSGVRYTPTATTLQLHWPTPPSHGEDITHYTVEATPSDHQLITLLPACTLEHLQPQTAYKVRVRAWNRCGGGGACVAVRASTLPLPPQPPVLSCPSRAHNYLKLKWGDNKNSSIQYTLQMEESGTEECCIVYQGSSQNWKVARLAEQTTYRFNICSANDAGRGPFSNFYGFSTTIAPPPSLKVPRASDITCRGCRVEWQSSRAIGADTILYTAQLSRLRDQEYKQVYRGSETRFELNDLEPGADYSVRVCPIRVTGGAGEVAGAWSPALTISTLSQPSSHQPSSNPAKAHNNQGAARKPLTDQQWAAIILSGFTLIAVLVAVAMQQFIY